MYNVDNHDPHGPYNESLNREEGQKQTKEPNNTGVVVRVITVMISVDTKV